MKLEIANELGMANYQQMDKGNLTARENGYVGGYMTKKLVEMAEQQMAGKQPAHLALHKEVNVPRSKMKEALAAILKQEGYVEDVAIDDRNITITLKYQKGKAVISGLKRISTPGRRVYVGAHQIPKVQNGLGICILSTSSGVLDGMTAHEKKVGGELLCEIW